MPELQRKGKIMNILQGADRSHWYVIRANPRQEERVTSNLCAWGVENFYPRLREGRRNQYTGAMTYFSKPMFPGYLFARFDADLLLSKIWYTRGVNSVVGFGGLPAPVDDEVIELLKSQVGQDGFIKLDGELRRGDKVFITDGPLKNFAGVFESRLKGSDRVMVLLNTVSYQGRLLVESSAVKKASETLSATARA